MSWVATLGAALASVPIASEVIDGYHLADFRRVWIPAVLPALGTALVMRLYLRWMRRTSHLGMSLLAGPLLGLLNTSFVAGLFGCLENGPGAGIGVALMALVFGFPIGLGVGFLYALVLWPLLARERALRGRTDVDAGLSMDAFAAGWASLVAGTVFALERNVRPLGLWPEGPGVAGGLALSAALLFTFFVAWRGLSLGRFLRRVVAGEEAGRRLVHSRGALADRFTHAEVVVLRVENAGDGPFRDGEVAEPELGLPSVQTLSRRLAWLALVALVTVGLVAWTPAPPPTTMEVRSTWNTW
ncbi:MAG: hypothetical protein H6722_05305 [Sandaracinus sp.]|nr:hypothetical protein [Sandaracinus sp.]MCB9623599.1 hypothetical protein [Sandaracinus sp.]